MVGWLKEEEELFKEAWCSGEYDEKTLGIIFQRSFDSLRKKAGYMGLPPWTEISGQTRLAAIKKALNGDHLI